MAFEQFPYTNFHDLNLDWILKEVDRVRTAVDTWSTEVLDAAKKYTDANVAAEAERANQAILELKQSTETAIRDFQNVVNGTLENFQQQPNSAHCCQQAPKHQPRCQIGIIPADIHMEQYR